MGDCILYGKRGGGNQLNFKVVGGTVQPDSPSDNTIWVNTDQTITSWDFNTTEPTNPVEGMVWFYTGSLGTVSFDALKKNSLILNTLFAKQYISEAWASKTVKVYQNEEWVDLWNGEFFENGIFHVMHTKYTVPETAPISEASDGITMSTVASKTSEVYVVFGPVSLDNISTLQMTSAFTDSISGTHRRILFISKDAGTSYKNAEAITNSSVTSGYKNSITITLDVSSFTGEYYVYAGQNTNGSSWDNARTLNITEVTSIFT